MPPMCRGFLRRMAGSKQSSPIVRAGSGASGALPKTRGLLVIRFFQRVLFCFRTSCVLSVLLSERHRGFRGVGVLYRSRSSGRRIELF